MGNSGFQRTVTVDSKAVPAVSSQSPAISPQPLAISSTLSPAPGTITSIVGPGTISSTLSTIQPPNANSNIALQYIQQKANLPSTGNSYLVDSDNSHYAQMENDGRLCVYTGIRGNNGPARWCTQGRVQGSAGPYFLTMTEGGNLCTYSSPQPNSTALPPVCYAPSTYTLNKANTYYAMLASNGQVCVYNGVQPNDRSTPAPEWCMGPK